MTCKLQTCFIHLRLQYCYKHILGSRGLAGYDTMYEYITVLVKTIANYTPTAPYTVYLSAHFCKTSSNLLWLTITICIPGDIQSETCRAQVSGTNQGIHQNRQIQINDFVNQKRGREWYQSNRHDFSCKPYVFKVNQKGLGYINYKNMVSGFRVKKGVYILMKHSLPKKHAGQGLKVMIRKV